jgi:hypothetical protein
MEAMNHRSAMNDEPPIPQETIEFLADLSKDDIHTLRTGLPLIRMVIGFGKVTKWLAITLGGFLLGTVMLGDAVMKIVSWFRHG